MAECTHIDCQTCPYPDCISSSGPLGRKRKKPGRKKLSPEVKQAHRREYDRKYYETHKEERAAYYKEYNKKNADKIREHKRAYRASKKRRKTCLT